jgi:hypothetical protein
MDATIKRRWVDALRSDKYRQGYKRLHSIQNGEECYCPLGVLCELAVEDRVVERDSRQFESYEDVEPYEDIGYRRSPLFATEYSLLPREVAEWAGLGDSVSPVVHLSDFGEEIVTLNDDLRLTFAVIADAIEDSL